MAKGKQHNKVDKAIENVKDHLQLNSQVEIISNREAIIHGAKGIIEYSDNVIRVSMSSFELRMFGANLTLKCLSPECLEIVGQIQSIEFAS